MSELNNLCGSKESKFFFKADFDISEYGILPEICETIVSTGFETPNAAPIGIIQKNGTTFVRIFKGSQTGENVFKEGVLVANVVYDPLLLVRTTFSKLELSEFDFLKLDGRNFPVLKAALSWVAFRCVGCKTTGRALLAELLPLQAGFRAENRKATPGPNRGFNAVLEATVHATRYQLTGDEKYVGWIRHYEELVRKCGGEKEKEAINLLYNVLDFE